MRFPPEEMRAAYREAIAGGVEADLFWIETMSDPREARIAVEVAREVALRPGRPDFYF
ncbi:MAG: hypothetical protein KatS3mg115_2357 [Candidatus Poribacteria bacterium]|nr:MAG: hypothetical protein KatS3mg115_2357 [Candidatus Poribacteria bacterium]